MKIEIYLKSGQTVVLDHVKEAKFEHDPGTGECVSWSITWNEGWQRKLTCLQPNQIAGACRVEGETA